MQRVAGLKVLDEGRGCGCGGDHCGAAETAEAAATARAADADDEQGAEPGDRRCACCG